MSITYKPSKRKRKRTHGFFRRSHTSTGRSVIRRRRRRRRKHLTV